VTTPANSIHSVGTGARLPLEAGRLLLRERQLWLPALIPVSLSVAAFSTAIAVVVGYAGEIHDLASGWMPVLGASAWYAWLWIGPAKVLLAILGVILFLGFAAGCLVVAFLVASLLAAPFHDWLSQRVERVVTGRLVDESGPGVGGVLRDALRSLREEARRIAFFVAVAGPLAFLGFVVPPAQVVTGPSLVLFTLLFLPLDYASYALDRRQVPFAKRRAWIRERLPTMLGFGVAAFVSCVVPLLSFVAMPLLVVAGTLLVLRHPPDGGPTGGAPSAPT
jgi:CysZ protein